MMKRLMKRRRGVPLGDDKGPQIQRGRYASEWEYLEDEIVLLKALSQDKAQAARVDRAIQARLKATAKAGGRLRAAALLREELTEHERLLVLAVLMERLNYREGTASMADVRNCAEGLGLNVHLFARHLSPDGRLFRERILRVESDGFAVDREFGVHPEFLQMLEGTTHRRRAGRSDSYAEWIQQVFNLLSAEGRHRHHEFHLTDKAALARLVRYPRDRRGTNPFFRVCREHGLSLLERQVLAVLLAGHVFDRGWDFTVEWFLNALETPVSGYFERVAVFSKEGRLRKARLVQTGASWRAPSVSFLGTSGVRLSGDGAATLLPETCLHREEEGRMVEVQEAPLALDDLVLPADLRRSAEDLIAYIRQGREVLQGWGLARLTYGAGTGALFYGPPGTGKTALAGAVARELERPLYVMETNKILSMWVGGTEQNIARVFALAEKAGAVLFIDEADSFLQDRGRAHHTWETTQVNTLLRHIERFNGLVVLATNHAVVLDKALDRRLPFKLAFALPDESARTALWRMMLGGSVPLDPGVDPAALARLPLSGGQIKNAVLTACLRATRRSGAAGPVTHADLLEAAEAEGRALTPKADTSLGFRTM
jgi:AAA+ superfamily predicted ATPase